MLAEVKKCADSGDIKGLRYIFVDCLDVDPTFEKYKADYDYCKNIPGMFDAHQELNLLTDNEALWNQEYWDQLKMDLMKNFSEKRFSHMITVAKVVYANKISRLMSERNEKKASIEAQIESLIPRPQSETEKVEKAITPMIIKEDASAIKSSISEEEQRIADMRKEIEENNRRVEAKQREEQERLVARRNALQNQNVESGDSSSKKWLGIGIVVAIIIVVLIIWALQ